MCVKTLCSQHLYCQNIKNVVRFRGVKLCWNPLEIIENFSGFRSRGVPVYLDFYTMKIEAENSGPKHLSDFEGILIYWRSGLEGFHCIMKLSNLLSPKPWVNLALASMNEVYILYISHHRVLETSLKGASGFSFYIVKSGNSILNIHRN